MALIHAPVTVVGAGDAQRNVVRADKGHRDRAWGAEGAGEAKNASRAATNT